MANLWSSADHALKYLAIADTIPHRTEGEGVLLDHVPKTVQRILDLGTGDDRLLPLLKIDRPQAKSVALDPNTRQSVAIVYIPANFKAFWRYYAPIGNFPRRADRYARFLRWNHRRQPFPNQR